MAESEIMHSIPFINYSVKVNRLFKITPEPLKMSNSDGELVEITAPGDIQVRLISSHWREGMIGENNEARKSSEKILPKSNALLIQIHGGGFVAQSSKSHLVYLFEWALNLNVPIFSIDYSLSPEHPYPTPVEEILYAYCWALKNAELLGTTCEKVVFCGDSAGATLCLATLLKLIDMNLRKPDGLLLAYCPILVGLNPSPSRLLSFLDPLVPFGFMKTCLKAYSNAQNSNNNEGLYDEQSSDLAEIKMTKRAKANRNEELKRNTLLNIEIDQEFSENSNESDSFEEVSCFERHQTDSDIKAHISQISDAASNDTLAGTSFLTGTDFKNSINDDIEIVSPDSVTSLEDDSPLPLTMQKNDKVLDEIDLQPTTSEETTVKNSGMLYVDDFIGKYVLDAKEHKDGSLKPILRKVSRTKSEENIIFDVSRESLSIQGIQAKFHRVASTLVESVSHTIDQITKTNRPIKTNYSCDDAYEGNMLENENFLQLPENDLFFNIPKDPFLSPFFADDEALKQFPHIKFISLTMDSYLDDSIAFAKRLKALNVDFTFDVLDGLPHGFLNFSRVSLKQLTS